MTAYHCPDLAQLERYAVHALDGVTRRAIDHHVTTCPACADRLRELGQLHAAESTDLSHPAADTLGGMPREDRARMLERVQAKLAPPAAPGEVGRLGQYRLQRLLGVGGMGLVFDALDEPLARRVALKVLRPELAEQASYRARFVREAQATAAIQHDHLVAVYAVGVEGELPYIAMPLLDGETLEHRLRRDGRLPVAEAVRVAREAALGLAAAHAHGLIHRDIKPGNLWLEAGSGRVKLLDFGLVNARSEQEGLTAHGLIVGTPHYMAPEQARNLPLNPQSDLFSLGCVLYRSLCGGLPFPGTDTFSVLTALAVDDPPPLDVWQVTVPEPLAKLVRQLMAKKREDRPGTATEVAIRLATVEAQMAPGNDAGLTRRAALVAGFAAVASAACGATWWLTRDARPAGGPSGPPLRVGVLHSFSGTMAASESPVADAAQLAIEELNAAGGVLGRPVVAVTADGASVGEVFAREAERLISTEGVRVVFGCWTSASRKTVLPVFARNDHLLVYPVQYEGLEQSPYVVYTGAAPNQQILPAVRWCLDVLGKSRFFLVGSDYVFPRCANAIIADALKGSGTVVGEEYLPLGSYAVGKAVDAVVASKPQVILNTINGGSNAPFFNALRAAGVTAREVPTVSFSIAEPELKALAGNEVEGDFAAWNYFQTIDRPANKRFVAAFQKKYGPQRVLSDPMEAAYVGVHLWAKAAAQAGTADTAAVRAAMGGQSMEAPGGLVTIDPRTHHTSKTVRIGRISRGQFDIVYSSEQPVSPVPYPPTRGREQWEAYLADLRSGWGGAWAKPGT